MLALKSYAPGPGASQHVYFNFGSLVFGLIENFHPSVPTIVGILYEPGPGIAFLKASEGCSFRYTFE